MNRQIKKQKKHGGVMIYEISPYAFDNFKPDRSGKIKIFRRKKVGKATA